MRVYFNLDVDDVTNLRLAAQLVDKKSREHSVDCAAAGCDLSNLVLRLIPGVEAVKAWTPEEILQREA